MVAVLLVAGTLLIASNDHAVGVADFANATGIVSFAFLFFVVFPQLSYKPRERTLEMSASGLDTSIGTQSGHRSWRDISSISDAGETIVCVVAGGIPLMIGWLRTRNGNAYVIPNRAFVDAAQRTAFLDQITAWHRAQAMRYPRFARNRYFE